MKVVWGAMHGSDWWFTGSETHGTELRTKTWQGDWKPSAQCNSFLLGLRDYIKDKLVFHELLSWPDGAGIPGGPSHQGNASKDDRDRQTDARHHDHTSFLRPWTPQPANRQA